MDHKKAQNLNYLGKSESSLDGGYERVLLTINYEKGLFQLGINNKFIQNVSLSTI